MSRLPGAGLRRTRANTVMGALPVLGRKGLHVITRWSNGTIRITPVDQVEIVGENEFDIGLKFDADSQAYRYDEYGNIEAVEAPKQIMTASIPKRMLLGIRWESVYGYDAP